jgi:hypothetical protein
VQRAREPRLPAAGLERKHDHLILVMRVHLPAPDDGRMEPASASCEIRITGHIGVMTLDRAHRNQREDTYDIADRGRARDDVAVHQQYIADIEAAARTTLTTVDPTPYYQKYGENLWAAVRTHLDAVAEAAAAPVIEKYTRVLGAVDVFTVPTAFSILESIRLDLGCRMDVHP